ncbi:hypothetical protein Ancab_031140 [Ancistrocladus abbreviatus]
MVSREDIKTVQNLIEQCIQLDMDRGETMKMLHEKAKIDPGFTELVWTRLEQENQEFFDAYRLRLALKHQIIRFNELLERQAELINQVQPSESSSSPVTTNGSSMAPVQQSTECYAAENAGPPSMAPSLSGAFNNGVTQYGSVHAAYDLSAPSGRADAIQNTLLAQNSDMRMMQRINGAMIKSESSCSSNPQLMFSADGSVLENRTYIRDTSSSCFNGMGQGSLLLNEPLLDMDMPTFELLGQLPRNFSLTDLTADYSRPDILAGYPRSPFPATDSDNFLNSNETGELQEENKRLDSISEGLSYEDFGSD